MKIVYLHILLLLAAAIAMPLATASPPSRRHHPPSRRHTPSPSIAPRPSDFIHHSCSATPHPDFCVTSLSRIADGIHHDPLHLAIHITKLSHQGVRSALARASFLSKSWKNLNPRETWALKDCMEMLGDAADGLREAEVELERLKGESVGNEKWESIVWNVQTWLSTATTYGSMCEDSFDEDEVGRAKDLVHGGVRTAKMFTSNALTLVNQLSWDKL